MPSTPMFNFTRVVFQAHPDDNCPNIPRARSAPRLTRSGNEGQPDSTR